jgi:hypothetical protein
MRDRCSRLTVVVSRARTTYRKRPILKRQPAYAAELGGVVCDEPEPETAGVSGNEERSLAPNIWPRFFKSAGICA